MDEPELTGIRECIDAGLRFAWVGGQLRVTGPRASMTRATTWLRQHRDSLILQLQQSPALFAEAYWPASDAQTAMWAAFRLAPHSAAYNLHFGIRCSHPLDLAALRRTVRQLLQRHDALRTALSEQGGHLQAALLPVRVDSIEVIDFSDTGQADAYSTPEGIARCVNAFGDRPFDLQGDNLLRVHVLKHVPIALQVALGYSPGARPVADMLFLVCHHAAVDFWGLQLLLQDFDQIYRLQNNNTNSILPCAVSYRTFCHWQQQYLVGTQGQRDAQFWQQQWSIPLAEPAPWQGGVRAPSYVGARIQQTLSPTLSAQIRDHARYCETTPFVLLLTAFALLQARYTQQAEAIIGSPVAARSSPDADKTVGHFANLLALRLPVSAPDGLALVATIKAQWLSAIEHGDYPFAQLMLQMQQWQGATALTIPPAVIVWHQANHAWLEQFQPMTDTLINSVDDIWPESGQRGAAYPLVLAVLDQGDGYRLEWTYDTALFDRAAIERRNADFLTLLAPLLNAEIGPPMEWPLMRPSILTGASYSTFAVAEPPPETLWARVQSAANQAPSRIAIRDVARDSQLTYAALAQAAAALATRMVQAGVQAGDRVGLWVERDLTWPLACVACWYCGAVFVPLDRQAPTARLRDIVADASIRLILDDATSPWPFSEEAICMLTFGIDDVYEDRTFIDCNVNAVWPAYVLYTSGSTGRPKGVQISQQNLLAYVDGFETLCQLPAETVATHTAYTFDVSMFEMGGALLQGRTLVILPDVLTLAREEWLTLLLRYHIDMLYVPPMLLDIVREAWLISGKPFPARLLTGVEPTAWRTLLAWLEARPDMDILNQYGPTETTVAVTSYRVSVADLNEADGGRVALGYPVPGIKIYLQDANSRVVSWGEPGEAVISGRQVGDGYIGHASEGDQRFFRNASDEWCFRTGDWMRIDEKGRLVYLGRADHQIKLRGVRIELGEVRAALLALPAVSAAWVEARRHASGIPFLVAHVETSAEVADIREKVREILPPLLVPSHFERHSALPLNRHGKIDAVVLAAYPLQARSDTGRQPESDAEWALWHAWCAELPEPPKDVTDNFFLCGGHSLVAARIASRLHAAGFDVTVAELLQHTEIASQAVCLHQRAADTTRLPRNLHDQVQISGPVLPFQFTLWAHEAMNGPSRAYVVPLVARVSRVISAAEIEHQWSTLAVQHEALRTAFVEVGMSVQQQVLAHCPTLFQHISVTLDASCQATLMALIEDNLRQPLSMHGPAPLWRVSSWEINGKETLIVAVFHHAIFDGGSIRALWQDWLRQQVGMLPLASLGMVEAVQTALDLQRQHQADGVAFWSEALSSCEPMEWIRPISPLPEAAGLQHLSMTERELPHAVLPQLQQLARRLNCTPFTIALCWFQITCARLCGHLNAAVAIPVDLREAPFKDVVGGLVNTVALPSRFHWNNSLTEAIRNTHDFLMASRPYRHVSLDGVINQLGGNAAQWLDTLFSAIFVWEADDVVNAPPGVEVIRVAPVEPKTDLEVVFTSDSVRFLWRTSRFEPTTIQTIADVYIYLLQQALDALETPVGELSLMPETRWLAQVNALNGSQPFSTDLDNVLTRFKQHCAANPDAVAIRYWHQSLSYQALYTQIKRYAGALQEAGIVRGDAVAFALPRVPETIAAMMAIWYAGAAYVPIDARWPAERQRQVIQASGCRVLLYCPELAAHLGDKSAEESNCNESCTRLTLSQLEMSSHIAKATQLTSLDQIAYILFTSGSTGRPKGVVINHQNLAAFLRWTGHFYPSEDFRGLLAVTTFAFDISVFEIFATLCHGGTICLAEDPLSLLDDELRAAYDGRLSFLSTVPSVAAAWLDAGVIPEGIRTVNMGGELLPQSTVDRWYAAGVGRVLDLWGPTEDTTYSMVETRAPGRIQSIGRPIDDTQMWVLDARLQPLPRGIKGELVVGGLGLSQGYLHDAEQTANVFLSNPFLSRFPDWAPRIYRSGDIGWQSAADVLHYCGRADFQVKVRGQRIELSEIEARLRVHPAVRTALVLVRDAGLPSASLFACVELQPEQTLSFDTLDAFVREALPAYMVPSQWQWISEWPLNHNGKIDRREMSRRLTVMVSETEFVGHQEPSLSALEETLAECMLSLVPGWQVSYTRSFEQMGLDSITLLKFSFALQRRLQLPRPLPLSVWLQHRHLRAIARYLQEGYPLATWTQLNEAPDSAPVLVCIHPVGGEITGFRALAKNVEGRWRVWAVALPDNLSGVDSLEALAQRYVDAWDEIGTTRVVLMGYSLGGLIASHMLTTLAARNVVVDKLILLDAFTPTCLAAHPVIAAFMQAADQSDPPWQQLYTMAALAGWVPAGMALSEVHPLLVRVFQLLRLALHSAMPDILRPVVHLASQVDGCASREQWPLLCKQITHWMTTPAVHAELLAEPFLDAVIATLADPVSSAKPKTTSVHATEGVIES